MTTPPIMSVTDELIDELEAESMHDDGTEVPISAVELRALLSERAELKRDAERYMAALTEAKYRIEQGRVWNGMGWTLTGLNPHGQQKALDAIAAAVEQTKC